MAENSDTSARPRWGKYLIRRRVNAILGGLRRLGPPPPYRLAFLPSICLVLAVVWGLMTVLLRRFRRLLAFLPASRCPAPLWWRLTLPVAVTLTRLVRPLCVFCLGMGE